MKYMVAVLFCCLLCFGLSGCGAEDKFVGVWEGRMGSPLLVSSSRMPVLAQIKRTSSENTYRVRVVAKTEKIRTNPVFEKVLLLSDSIAVLEDGRLVFADGSTAEIDPQTGKLHMDGTVYTKTDYDIDIF